MCLKSKQWIPLYPFCAHQNFYVLNVGFCVCMSLTAKDMVGQHLLDLVSLSNPEIASFGNTSNGAYIKWYHNNAPSTSSYRVGFDNNTFNIRSDSALVTRVGIGTSAANASANLHVQGTLMTSTISTYEPNNTLSFDQKNIGGISNISFTGNLYQGASLFKTSQWETVSAASSNIYYPGNVGIGGIAGSGSNLFVVGNVFVTGRMYAQDFLETSTLYSGITAHRLYSANVNGYRQIETNATNYANRVLFSMRLKMGRYFLNATVPYKNLSSIWAMDTFGLASIGLYRATPATLSGSTTPVCTMQMKNIGSANSTDVSDVNIAWYVEIPSEGDYVIAVYGVGHILQFGPYITPSEPVRLVSIPVRALGTSERIDVSHALQAKPIRTTFKVNGATYLNNNYYEVSTDGYYDIQASNIDIFLTSGSTVRKLSWINSTINDFDIANVTFQNNRTSARIYLRTTPLLNDTIDTTVWLNNTADSYFESGYLYQNFNVSSVPWQIIQGGGVRLPESRCVIDGDLFVSGNIYGGCNTSGFTSGGILMDYFDDFSQNSNIVGTLNVAPGAITIPKLDLQAGNLGIGTLSPPEKLMVVGNIVPGANNTYDLGTSLLSWRDVRVGRQIVSSVATGTAPLVVASTTQVTNLNASLLGGQDTNYYRNVANMNAGTLPIGRGGTNATAFTQNKLVVVGNNILTSPNELHWTGTNLGIGTTTPSFTMDVLGNARIQHGTVAALNLTAGNIGGIALATSNNSKLLVNPYVNYTDVVLAGKVGIGTTTPANALTVQGEVRSLSNVMADRQFLGQNGSATIPTFSWSSSTNTGLYAPTTNTMAFATNGIERIRILTNGNIGIGTTNPDSQLVVSGSSGRVTSKINNQDLTSQIVFMMGFEDGNEFFIQKNKTNLFDIDGLGMGGNNIALFRNRNANMYFQSTNFGCDSNGQMIYTHRHILSAYLKLSGGTRWQLSDTIGQSNIIFNNYNYFLGASTNIYNSTTGIFTAPLNGRYYVSSRVYVDLQPYTLVSSFTPTDATIVLRHTQGVTTTTVDGFTSSIARGTTGSLPGEVCLSGDATVVMSRNDTLRVEVIGTGRPRLITAESRSALNVIYLG